MDRDTLQLADENCVRPNKNDPGPGPEEIAALGQQVPGWPNWKIVDHDGTPHLQRVYEFGDFGSAMSFAAKVGASADEQDHHPRITVEWGSLLVEWWTHATGGLHRNDFIMAARSDRAFSAN
jgi:4a-hydroxytetrahydrobiopterin dehydratase